MTLTVTNTTVSAQQTMDQFVSELMAKMTLEEKLGQLNLLPAGDITTGAVQNNPIASDIRSGKLGGIFNLKGPEQIAELQRIAVEETRLGIPLIVGMDVIHGYETVFPIPLALACSWDLAAVEESTRIAAKEASASGINWTYSPMVDIALDARWGRIAEGAGEDPYLGSLMAAAQVRGYQGDLSGKENIMACVKHFALYGAAEGGRDYNTVDMSRLRMYNQYLPPYRAAVEAGAGSVMSSFNIVDGIPATANRWLLTDLLRSEWGFKGFVVTDYSSITEMQNHGCGALKPASAKALRAGTDMDMCAKGFEGTLAESLAEGKVTQGDIDTACRRVLEAKYRLGLFADPYRYNDLKRVKTDVYSKQHREAARRIAAETFVLLKNNDHVLPLKKQGTIALIGPLADTRNNLSGSWSVCYAPEKYLTLREAMQQALGRKARLLYAQGCNISRDEALQVAAEFGRTIQRVDDRKAQEEALRIAREADVVVCAMGECSEMNGESSSRADLEMPEVQRELLAKLKELGKPVVLLNFSGRPTVLTWESEHVDAIMNVWFGGSEAGDAICDVLFGKVAPSGRLSVSMPRTTGQEPLYYNVLPTGRPVADGAPQYYKFQSNYLDFRNGALYPFGFGLSYVDFSYGQMRLSSSTMTADGSVEASVEVTNNGDREADEVVQLYIHDLEASITRPLVELKDFQRIRLKAGETRTVTFRITADKLKFYDYDLQYVLEPGDFDIMIGPDSRTHQSRRLTVVD
ncbi:MAG: beta-glucosidase BglX [Prevotella sp.]|nr:beta-glucosidase BglX [Prevotella sp.]